MLITRGCGHYIMHRIHPLLKTSQILNGKERDNMIRASICPLCLSVLMLVPNPTLSVKLTLMKNEPLNISLASSFNCIRTYQKEIKLIEQAIGNRINVRRL